MTDQIIVMDRLLNHTEGQGYIYCLKVVIQLLYVIMMSGSMIQCTTQYGRSKAMYSIA